MSYGKNVGSFAGALALAVLIWVAGPLIGIGPYRPLGPAWVRLLIIATIFLTLAGVAGWRIYKRREAAKKLAEGIAAPNNESDARILSERMNDALATLKKATGTRGDYLYELPWYVIIGPPGAGKTTALLNSGLKFPLARSNAQAYVEGVGGTRYCDWWFTEEAVLIDTAGRYTTQDFGGTGDRQSWLSFLDLLRKNRARQPINGVIVAIGLEQLMTASPAAIQADADAIRLRLLELHERLKVNFPVYALFTKADLVAGFREYFSDLREVDRRMVWGATFQTEDRTRNMIGEVPAEFDALIERLNQRLPDRMQEELNHTARVLLFGFPTQMMGLRRPLIEFLDGIFEPTRYHANAMLRGFYFTSGTQQGTPIDHLVGAMVRTFASDDAHLAYSGLGKSFFLTDLLTKVIFGEAGWVSTNRAATRRTLIARSALYIVLAVLAAALIGLWSVENRALIADSNTHVDRYRTSAASLLQLTRIKEYDLGPVLDVVLSSRSDIPPRYDRRDDPVPQRQRWGLNQQPRLASSLELTYERILERTFRPRLLFRLEEQLKAHIDDPSYVYEALKAYMMLGGLHKSDDGLVIDWERHDWATDLYPGPRYVHGRKLLEEHLRTMLDLDVGQRPIVELNGPLISEAQKTLARMTLADRAYLLLKSEARASGIPDWSALDRGGPDVADVFETPDEGTLDAVRVPGFFTYNGFHEGFLKRIKDVQKRLANDQWLLGDLGEQPIVTAQYDTLGRDLLQRYNEEFIQAWTTALGELRLRPMTAQKQLYSALHKASAPTSPIRYLLQSLRDETALDVERAPPAAQSGTEVTATNAAQPDAAADANVDTGFTTPGDASNPYGKEIALYFTPLNNLVAGEPGSQPIDQFLNKLADIHKKLQTSSQSDHPEQGAGEILDAVTQLKTEAESLPRPVSTWITQATDDIASEVADASVTQLSQLYQQTVGKACTQMLANRYPFSAASSQDVLMKDFSTMFQPGGVFDKFFTEHLDRLVDRSNDVWAWRQGSRLTTSLSLDSLHQFQRAADIRDTFFTSGAEPSVSFTVTPTLLSPGVDVAKLKINTTIVEASPGVNTSTPVEWPGPQADNHAAIAIQSATFGQQTPVAVVERQGPWAFFRLLDIASMQRNGDSLVATFTVQGLQATFAFNANSVRNPFFGSMLRDFRCPAGL